MTPHKSYNLSLCVTNICQREQGFRGQEGSPGIRISHSLFLLGKQSFVSLLLGRQQQQVSNSKAEGSFLLDRRSQTSEPQNCSTAAAAKFFQAGAGEKPNRAETYFSCWLELFSLRIQLKQSYLLLPAGFEFWLREMDRQPKLQQRKISSQAMWMFLPKPHHRSSRLTGVCLGFQCSPRLFSSEG